MQESPPELCRELIAQWRNVCGQTYIEKSARARINEKLTELQEHIRTCDDYDVLQKPMAGEYAALEYGQAFLSIPGHIRHLNRVFTNIAEACHDHAIVEDVNLLNTLLRRTQQAAKETYQFPDKILPSLRTTTSSVRRDCPSFPLYREDTFSIDQLTELRDVRRRLEIIAKIDIALAKMPEDNPEPAKALLKQVPDAIIFIGTDTQQTMPQITQRVQDGYVQVYHEGLGIMVAANHGNLEAAENFMHYEADVIQAFYVNPLTQQAKYLS